ncbi:MAG TPA: helical backbone metal receptor [Polyangiaceae bacterium]|nr:helical backbone metal receptor [Polyangiaceae bacterium]
MNRRALLRAGLAAGLGAALLGGALALGSWARGPSKAPPSAADRPRLVSLAPAVTETLERLGAGPQLVATSDFCRERSELPRVGTVFTPRLEAIAAARPTLILTTHVNGVSLAAIERLAPTLDLPWLTVTEVASSVRRLGIAASRSAEANALAARFERELGRPAPASGPRVLLLLDDASGAAGYWYIKTNSLHGALLAAAGARNARPEPTEAAPRLSVEELLAVDPDAIVILGADEKPGPPALFAQLERLSPLRAVREHRLGQLRAARLLDSGPGLLDFVQPLRDEVQRISGSMP